MSDIPYFVCFIDAEYEIRWIRRNGEIVAVQPLRFAVEELNQATWICLWCHSTQGYSADQKCFACEGPLAEKTDRGA